MMRRIKIEIELEIQIFTSRCLNVLHNSRLFYIYKIFYIVNLGYVGSECITKGKIIPCIFSK